MPNHITNVIKFNCSVEKFTEIANFLKGGDDKEFGSVDFNQLIPMPESLNIEAGSRGETGYRAYLEFLQQSSKYKRASTKEKLEESFRDRFKNDPEIWELGKQYYENIKLYGVPHWYDWCCDHWGTKWNAYDCTPVTPEERNLIFLTAWDGVPEIVLEISKKYPDVEIEYKYADEDFGSNVGTIHFYDGEVECDDFPDWGSNEAIEMAAEVMGVDPSEYGYVKNEHGDYEWHDPWEDENENED